MSVVIKGMTIPDSCSKCQMRGGSFGTLCKLLKKYIGNERGSEKDKRMDDCPLVEIKSPHGRLIDADEMKALWKGCSFEGDITCLLDARPTVLERED